MKCNTCDTEKECYSTLYNNNYHNNDGYYILAHYGSKHDMQRFALKLNKYKTGEICDDCIGKFIENGCAWMIEDGVW